ncbi:hypothetical protein [Actinopolymorpha pittospori]
MCQICLDGFTIDQLNVLPHGSREDVYAECARKEKEAAKGDGWDPGPFVTKSGRVLTDADIEALANEAERGYELP